MSKTFVLVHGSCHAGWTWQPVAEHLRRQGHRVHMPTLPGSGTHDERADIHLADMVDHLVDYVEMRDLTDIVLVGHSWGGFPISGASARREAAAARREKSPCLGDGDTASWMRQSGHVIRTPGHLRRRPDAARDRANEREGP